MIELDYKESWTLKKWWFWTVVLVKTLFFGGGILFYFISLLLLFFFPLDFKEIQPIYPKRDQSWVLIGRTDVEAETPILWPPDMSWLIGKYPYTGKDWRQEEKETAEYKIVKWYHWLDGHEFDKTSGVVYICVSFSGLCGRRRGWAVSREQHQNMYIIKGETDHHPRLDAWDKCSGLVHWEDPEERWEVGEGIGMGNTCKSMADSCQCMTKTTTVL